MDRFVISFAKVEVPKFSLGNLSITPGLKAQLSHEEIVAALKRHMLGDWGDLEDGDKAANEAALTKGGRLISAYQSATGTRFWIITEADRSYTTLLLPEEY